MQLKAIMLQQNLIYMAKNGLPIPFVPGFVVFVVIFFVVKPVPASGFPVGSDLPVASIRIDK